MPPSSPSQHLHFYIDDCRPNVDVDQKCKLKTTNTFIVGPTQGANINGSPHQAVYSFSQSHFYVSMIGAKGPHDVFAL